MQVIGAAFGATRASLGAVLRSLTEERRGELPALNGFRTYAILLVPMYHTWAGLYQQGLAPVRPEWYPGLMINLQSVLDLFFILSGFLISGALLNEYERRRAETGTGRIDLRRFFRRRHLRIWPAYYFFLATFLPVAVGFAVANNNPQELNELHALIYEQSGALLHEALYIMNYSRGGNLLHTWSLAIEQHFYLIFPFAAHYVLFRLSTGRRIAVLLLLYALPFFFRWWTYAHYVHTMTDHDLYIYRVSHCRADSLIAGILLMEVYRLRPRLTSALARLGLGVIGAAMFAYSYTLRFEDGLVFNAGRYNFFAISQCLLIYVALQPGSVLGRLPALPIFRPIARISYSTYLWHLMAVGWGIKEAAKIVTPVPGNDPAFVVTAALIATAASFVLGLLAYALTEFPWFQLRDSAPRAKDSADGWPAGRSLPADPARRFAAFVFDLYLLFPVLLLYRFHRALPDFGREAYVVPLSLIGCVLVLAAAMTQIVYWKRYGCTFGTRILKIS